MTTNGDKKTPLVVEDDLGGHIPKIEDGPWPAFPADLTSIAVAVAGSFGDPEDHGQIANEPAAIRKLIDRLAGPDTGRKVAYEAGPTGHALRRNVIGQQVNDLFFSQWFV